jgi:hypothetical protein
LNRSNFQEATPVTKKSKKQYTKAQIAGLKARALKLWKADNTHAMEFGKALLAVRAALRGQHGAFRKWWEDHRLVQSRVSYCMDLAKGKLGIRKIKAKAATNTRAAKASREVGKKLNGLFLSCTRATNVDAIRALLKETIGETLGHTAKLAGWKTETPEVKAATDKYTEALNTLIATLSKGTEKFKAAGATAGR